METITKLTPELLVEIKDIQEKLSSLLEVGVIDVDPYRHAVHMRGEAFDANFPNIEATPIQCNKYPYRKSVTVGYIEYFALYKEV